MPFAVTLIDEATGDHISLELIGCAIVDVVPRTGDLIAYRLRNREDKEINRTFRVYQVVHEWEADRSRWPGQDNFTTHITVRVAELKAMPAPARSATP